MSLSRHPACPRQGPAVPVLAPSRVCLMPHRASRKFVVSSLLRYFNLRLTMKISGWRMPISGRRTERRWVLLNYFYFPLFTRVISYVFRGCVSRLIFVLVFSFFSRSLSTNFSTNFTTRLGKNAEPTIARSTWRPVFVHRTRVPASNSVENVNSGAGLFVNT